MSTTNNESTPSNISEETQTGITYEASRVAEEFTKKLESDLDDFGLEGLSLTTTNNESTPSNISEETQTRITYEASRVAEEFTKKLEYDLKDFGLKGLSSRGEVVSEMTDWIQTAIEKEVTEGVHEEGWEEHHALRGVWCRPTKIGKIPTSDNVVVLLDTTVSGDKWSTPATTAGVMAIDLCEDDRL
ncbi:hypothetical protein B9479_003733 [Cryptococcus floricola]|uniref:Uncharacterized protein n=1 Tax=Cryptococcus floricola TaxID=2591691 RepID=A0A5D3AZR9_9TREE|nr:hypothetical protein B9479_003733 [Cryptococcus floricola]